MSWHVYLLRCSDGSYYTGIARDLEARVAQHNSGQGAKYTRGRRPVQLVYRETADDRSSAQSREWHLRRLSAAAKRELAAAQP